MILELISQPLDWPSSVSGTMQELCHDWDGATFAPPARFRLVQDPSHLWLIAGRNKATSGCSSASCGEFKAELWKQDVAELFIASPDFKNYLEFNLSPRGAWWTALFSGPRSQTSLGALPEVTCRAGQDDAGVWNAAMGIPLEWLCETIAWGEDSPLNVTFILDSPHQRFLTACDLGEGEPDFHRPEHFQVPNKVGPEV